jgi:pilus assembly protein CpaB
MGEKTDLTSALHKAADRRHLRSGLRAALFFAVALVAAVGSALLLTRYMEARTAAARVPTDVVLVADLDLPVGTELRPEHLRAVAWPMASLPEGAFKDPKELEGKVLTVRLYKGEAFLPTKLAGSDAGRGLSALLPPGMRAVAVRVDDVVGVAGFIHPGDVVDVIVTLRTDGGGGITASKVILQGIKVLTVGKELDAGPRSAEKVVQATVATLMVDAEQSERLALAASKGKLLLALRGAADTEAVATRGVNANTLLSREAPAPAPASRPSASVPRTRLVKATPPPEPAHEPRRDVVEIMRGDVFERRTFTSKEATR